MIDAKPTRTRALTQFVRDKLRFFFTASAEPVYETNQCEPIHQIAQTPTAIAPQPITENQPTIKEDNLPKTATDIEKRMSAFERATLRWTTAMFVVTTATALFIGFQWKEMHDTGDQTERIIKADERLAKAMEESVTEAQKGLNASIDISRNDQRAWVGITGIFIRTFVAGQKSDVNIPLQNSGKTAAVEVRTRSFVNVSDTPIDVAAFVATRHDPFKSHLTVFPNITDVNITLVSPLPWSDADITAIKSGRKFMYVFGEIRYKDVFERPHHTLFCGIYATDTPSNMRFCEQYNGAD